MRPWLFRWENSWLGDLSIPGYFFMFLVGFVVTLSLIIREARRVGEPVINYLDLTWLGFLTGVTGARLGHLIFESPFIDFKEKVAVDATTLGHTFCNWAGYSHGVGTEWNMGMYYLLHPVQMLAIWNGGMVYYGGVLLCLPILYGFCRHWGISYWRAGDFAGPGLLIGLALGRMGCLMAGCCYGMEAKGWAQPFGLMFHSRQVEGSMQGIPLVPTQILESVVVVGIAALLFYIRKFKRYDGQVFLWMLVLYGLWRPVVELLRADSQRGVHAGVTTSQLISAGLITLAWGLSFYLKRREPIPVVR